MDGNQALDLVAKGLNMANQKGVFDLNTAATLVEAIKTLSAAIAPKKTYETAAGVISET